MATNLIIYNSLIPSSVLLKNEAWYKNYKAGTTATLYDTAGVATADIGTWVGTLSAIYTEIYIFAACEATTDTTPDATINCTQQAALYALLIAGSVGTLSAESAVADTHTATTIGVNGGFTGTNSVVGTPDAPSYVLITAGTGNGQLSTIKSNTVNAVTIYGTFYAAAGADSKYKIVTAPKFYVVGQAQVQSASVTKTRAELGWTALYPGITLPVINSYYAGVPGYALKTGTNTTGSGAATLIDSSLSSGTTEWVGKWVVIYDATANGYQYGQILSHTTTTITLTANWPLGTPTGTGKVYRIYAREVDCLKDIYLQLWMMTNMTLANSNSTHLANLTRLIDNNGALANGTAVYQTNQDLVYLSEILAIGKTYLDFVHGGVSVAIPT